MAYSAARNAADQEGKDAQPATPCAMFANDHGATRCSSSAAIWGAVAPGFTDYLWSAGDINEAGQITGRLINLTTGTLVSFAATPIVEP